MDPQWFRLVEFNAACGSGAASVLFGDPSGPDRGVAPGLAVVHFPRAVGYDRLRSTARRREGTVGELTSRWLTGNQPFQAGCSGAEGRPRASRPLGPSGGVSTGRDRVHPVPADRSSRDRFGIGRARPLNQGQWRVLSAFHPTRLETRTKESNMRASHWAVRNPEAQ